MDDKDKALQDANDLLGALEQQRNALANQVVQMQAAMAKANRRIAELEGAAKAAADAVDFEPTVDPTRDAANGASAALN